IAGQAAPAKRRRACRGGQDGDAVKALLAVPDAVIAGAADLPDRETVIVALDLLKAERVGLLLVQIFEQPRQPRADAVQIVGDDLHDPRLAQAGQTEKLVPQPQPEAALGLVTWKAEPPRLSTKSTVQPRTRSSETGSTT